MNNTFKAFRIHEEANQIQARIENIHLEDLSDGDVVIRAHYSSINYKDALAATGKGKILRRYPLVGGIDVSGVVVSSNSDTIALHQEVLVTGCGLSENHDGGYAQYVRVPAKWVVPLPANIDLFDAMALGTAGFTAALAIHSMERNGQTPEMGPVLVTGASGGVGTYAISMLSRLGYEVVALTGNHDAHDHLRDIGAGRILVRDTLQDKVQKNTSPLGKSIWGGAIDCVGGDILAWLTRTIRPRGNIVSVGMAASSELHTTVMPFILRGINLLGVSSANCPTDLRHSTWQRIASELLPDKLDQMVADTIAFDALPETLEHWFDRTQVGRVIVKIQGHDQE